MSNQLTIGSFIHLKNENFEYLETCGYVRYEPFFAKYADAGAVALVQTTSVPNRDQGSGTWKILSADGKPEGETLYDTDRIHLLNCYPNVGYLALFDRIVHEAAETLDALDPKFGGGSFVFTVDEDSLQERLSVATFSLAPSPSPSSQSGWVQDNPIAPDSKVTVSLASVAAAAGRNKPTLQDPTQFPVDNRTVRLQAFGPLDRLGNMLTVDYPDEQTGLVFAAAYWENRQNLDDQEWKISLSDFRC